MNRHLRSLQKAGVLAVMSLWVNAASAELVINGSFEKGDLTGWTASAGSGVVKDLQLAHSGDYCAKISGAQGSLRQVITGLTPNTTYTLVGYVRLQKAGEHAFVGVRNQGAAEDNRVADAISYTKLALKFVTGKENTSAELYFTKDNGTGDAYGDDFSVIEGINDLDVVDSWLFAPDYWDARDRRLLEVLQPDVVHRLGFYWIGTQIIDRNYEGVLPSLMELRDYGSRNSRILGAGVSGRYWEPDLETLGPNVDREKARGTVKPRSTPPPNATTPTPPPPTTAAGMPKNQLYQLPGWPDINRDAENQLIFKSEKQIDAGFFDIEYDELYPSAYIVDTLHAYAQTKYGRNVFVMGNPNGVSWGAADYYVAKYYSYRDAKGNFDGTANPVFGEKTSFMKGDKNLPYFWFVDFPGVVWLAPSARYFPNALRLSQAWILAAGNHFPSWLKSSPNSTDSLTPGNIDYGVFNLDANMIKFLKENTVLWHNLREISPATFTVSNAGRVWKKAYTQPMRTIVHLVNGNFDNETQAMPREKAISLQISLDAPPAGVWLTTPDKLAKLRKITLRYAYGNGVATIKIPELYFHDIIVIEQGPANTAYHPVYAPLRVVFPFPTRASLPIGNTTHLTAIQNEGYASTYHWLVNHVSGGNAALGTIDGDGNYHAPSSVPAQPQITLQAVSEDDSEASCSCALSIVASPPLPWSAGFAADTPGAIPADWEIVDGQGDWEVAQDGAEKVLHNSNLMDGMGYGGRTAITNPSGYDALIVAGDQRWTDYDYSFEFKPIREPMVFYSTRGNSRYGVMAVFRYQDHRNFYWYQLCTDNKVRLFKNVNGSMTEINAASTPVCDFPAVGDYMPVEVEAVGPNFKILVNGKTIRADTDMSLPAGGVGLETSLTENYFRKISVKKQAALE